MEKIVLQVEGMSCQHCVAAITKALNALSGVSGVDVDLKAKSVAVAYDPAQSSLEQLRQAIEDQGYDVVA